MDAQGTCIILYSVATPLEEYQLSEQLADIGYTHIVKLNDRDQLEKLILDSSFSALVLLMTDAKKSQSAVLDILHLARKIPFIGLFSQHGSLCDWRIVTACHEVVSWPCSNQDLDYRIRKFTANWQEKELGLSLFFKMNILGNSPEFLKVLDKVCKVKKCDAPVFIDGETGTGKELIARAIHYLSKRKDQPFIAANCGAFPDQLIENEFFGHKKGAYTDARESSGGIIAQAEGGTLFLDEIETLSPKGQVTLLRFLENMIYRPLGSKNEKRANIRVITATNENISQLVDKGHFRKDLYYRINVMNILLPPLRERSGDINLLADHFIRLYQVQYNQPEKELHANTKEAMKYYEWPGNVRELENILHREFLMADGKYISIQEIESMKRERRDNRGDRRFRKMFDQPLVKAKNNLIHEFEQQYLSSALGRANGNISEAARLAGKERRTFTRLLEKYNLSSALYKTH